MRPELDLQTMVTVQLLLYLSCPPVRPVTTFGHRADLAAASPHMLLQDL